MSQGQEEAERLVLEGIKAAGLRTKELEGLPGGDPRKVALEKLVRERTVASCGWLAARLKMRSAANVSQTLRRTGTEEPDEEAAEKARGTYRCEKKLNEFAP